MLHDVGKSSIDHSILYKPGRLDDAEMAKMQQHAEDSERQISVYSHNEFYRQVIPAVRGHHERLDGRGYPDKLHGEDVPLISRIILIVDTLDAMSQDRPYRKGLPIEVVYQELKKFAGTQFDAQLVNIFLECHESWAAEQRDLETVEKVWKAG
jgi:HD-GYP domain-containing protein (c-di-GMP phosphodiesterase class II)